MWYLFGPVYHSWLLLCTLVAIHAHYVFISPVIQPSCYHTSFQFITNHKPSKVVHIVHQETLCGNVVGKHYEGIIMVFTQKKKNITAKFKDLFQEVIRRTSWDQQWLSLMECNHCLYSSMAARFHNPIRFQMFPIYWC